MKNKWFKYLIIFIVIILIGIIIYFISSSKNCNGMDCNTGFYHSFETEVKDIIKNAQTEWLQVQNKSIKSDVIFASAGAIGTQKITIEDFRESIRYEIKFDDVGRIWSVKVSDGKQYYNNVGIKGEADIKSEDVTPNSIKEITKENGVDATGLYN